MNFKNLSFLFLSLIGLTSASLSSIAYSEELKINIVNVSSQDLNFPKGSFKNAGNLCTGNWWYGNDQNQDIAFHLPNNHADNGLTLTECDGYTGPSTLDITNKAGNKTAHVTIQNSSPTYQCTGTYCSALGWKYIGENPADSSEIDVQLNILRL